MWADGSIIFRGGSKTILGGVILKIFKLLTIFQFFFPRRYVVGPKIWVHFGWEDCPFPPLDLLLII